MSLLFSIIADAASQSSTSETTSSNGWGVAIGSTGAFGLVCYLLYWLLTKYIPDLTSKHADTLQAVTQVFGGTVDKIHADSEAQRQTFAGELKSQRDNCREEQQTLVTRLDQKDQQIIDLLKKGP